jgi:hypothetical protein
MFAAYLVTQQKQLHEDQLSQQKRNQKRKQQKKGQGNETEEGNCKELQIEIETGTDERSSVTMPRMQFPDHALHTDNLLSDNRTTRLSSPVLLSDNDDDDDDDDDGGGSNSGGRRVCEAAVIAARSVQSRGRRSPVHDVLIHR